MALLLNLSALQSLKEINKKQQEIHFIYYILLLTQKNSIVCMEKLPEPWEMYSIWPVNSKLYQLNGTDSGFQMGCMTLITPFTGMLNVKYKFLNRNGDDSDN